MATAPKAVQKAPTKGAPDASELSGGASQRSSNKLVIILIALLVAVIAGGGAAWYFMGQKAGANGTKVKEAVKPPVFMTIDPFTVNLQPDGIGEQYLQVAFSVQVADQKEADTIKVYLPQVRSRLLLLLSGKKASEILSTEGKKKLAEEIIAQINQPFVPGSPSQNVTNVFFTSFVIQ
jgi:flagellar FliL protein